MFKTSFLEYLRLCLESLTPDGYAIKVIDDYGYGAKDTPKFTIGCYVKMGVASKQLNTSTRINQPVIFTIISEGDDHRMAYQIFMNFFNIYSRTHTTITVEDEIEEDITYDVWLNFNSPTIQDGLNVVGLNNRKTIVMMGVVSYSLAKIIGVNYYINNEQIEVINPDASYNTEANTPNYNGDDTGRAMLVGANNTYSFTMLLDDSDLSLSLLETSIIGTKLEVTLKIEYKSDDEEPISYEVDCLVTAVGNKHDSSTGDNILSVTLMKK